MYVGMKVILQAVGYLYNLNFSWVSQCWSIREHSVVFSDTL